MGRLLRKVAHPYLAKIDRLKIVTIMPSGHGSATCRSKYSSRKLESDDQRFCSPTSLLKRLKGYEHLLDLCRDKGVYNRNLKHEAQGPKGAESSEANFIARPSQANGLHEAILYLPLHAQKLWSGLQFRWNRSHTCQRHLRLRCCHGEEKKWRRRWWW